MVQIKYPWSGQTTPLILQQGGAQASPYLYNQAGLLLSYLFYKQSFFNTTGMKYTRVLSIKVLI